MASPCPSCGAGEGRRLVPPERKHLSLWGTHFKGRGLGQSQIVIRLKTNKWNNKSINYKRGHCSGQRGRLSAAGLGQGPLLIARLVVEATKVAGPRPVAPLSKAARPAELPSV